ncbi:MAG: hypothetical protein KC476_06935 [Cyanobacteria bacterium HKST-UBA06]|nr:hypothetical protein [Cyanobacteria bacterium HKST-UBA05]MCA9799471.1 hypothetical protein [Cyanobacteria bacterium HKST-UBA04]MCA9807674.1 hypothetical protein [Cyanobacteria bacterium HKST-UBA06]
MSVANCDKCGKVFKRLKSTLCSDCQVDFDALTRDVYHYINDNPGVSVAELSESFGVDLQEMEEVVKKGEIGMAKHSVLLNCKGCKRDVFFFETEGNYCKSCSKKVRSVIVNESPKHKSRMYYRDKMDGSTGSDDNSPAPEFVLNSKKKQGMHSKRSS